MLRIGQVEVTATSDGKYTDGSVAGGIAATRLRATAFNAIQEELAYIVESAAITLNINDTTQVLTALKKLFLSRSNPFSDIKADGAAAIATALSNLGLANSSGYTGRLLNVQVFTDSGTYTPSAGTKKFRARLVGGGGAGGGAAASTTSGRVAAGHGGGAGTYGETGLIDASSVSSVPVTVGSGGTGSLGGDGSAGGSSSFGSYITAPGGGGGSYGASTSTTQTAVNDDNNGNACTGSAVLMSVGGQGGRGQFSLNASTTKGGPGGSSVLGAGGAAFTKSIKGGNGSGYGAGGAGSITIYNNAATAGGDGTAGIVIVEEYA